MFAAASRPAAAAGSFSPALPATGPAGDLRARGLVADIERIVDVRASLQASRGAGLFLAGAEQRMHFDQIAAHGVLELAPAGSSGARGIPGTHAPQPLTCAR